LQEFVLAKGAHSRYHAPSRANILTSRVLVVDDHAPWRQQLASLLESTSDWRVIGEAADGPPGVAMAAALRPDLIALDMQLPTLTGIQTAAQILDADPAARILFVSGHKSWDVVTAALGTGARGYVLKVYAADDLLPAMRAVVEGRRFVSAVLGGRPHQLDLPVPVHHEAGFYLDDAMLDDAYERFAADALAAGKAVVGVASATRRAALRQRLGARGIDIGQAVRRGQYTAIDVAELLTPIMVNGMPDEARFWQGAVPLMLRSAQASRLKHPVVAAFGDTSQSLWNAGQLDAAIRLERLWHECTATFNLELFCGYYRPSGNATPAEEHRQLCLAHSTTHTR
jgi:DNA-binding NarL/FixJ family response regulator